MSLDKAIEHGKEMRKPYRGSKAFDYNGDCGVLNIRYTDANDVQRVENVVMSWAAENPEPVYPTWGEYLHTLHNEPSSRELSKPIPADIAQKLGLEPKEG